MAKVRIIEKYNHNHGADGRFTTSGGAVTHDKFWHDNPEKRKDSLGLPYGTNGNKIPGKRTRTRKPQDNGYKYMSVESLKELESDMMKQLGKYKEKYEKNPTKANLGNVENWKKEIAQIREGIRHNKYEETVQREKEQGHR